MPNSTKLPGPDGVGLELALTGYATWVNETMLPGFCESFGYDDWAGELNTLCFNTYNFSSPMFRDETLSNQVYRQWVWMTCDAPFGYWQHGAPWPRPSIVSRLVTEEYWVRQCGLFFPEEDGFTYGLARGRTYDTVNNVTGGWWFDDPERLVYVNGDYDP